MEILNIAAALITIAAVFSYLNYRFIKLPTTIGLMLIGLVFSLSLLALQNNKRLKMRSYNEQWYQFHLERPPTKYQQQAFVGGKMGKAARRGRW